MRKLIATIFIGLIIFFYSPMTFAQGQGKGKEKLKEVKEKLKEKGKEAKVKVEEIGEDVDETLEEAAEEVEDAAEQASEEIEEEVAKVKGPKNDKGGKGNAYGKNKGDMSGKEFGKLRSEEAKSKAAAKQKELDDEISKSEDALATAVEKVKAAKEKVAKQIENGELSTDEASKKESAIAAAEAKLEELKSKIADKKKAAGRE